MHTTKQLILKYFQAWQHKEWDLMRSCVAKDFTIDGGQIQFPSFETFMQFCQHGPAWSNVRLLSAIFQENSGALLYEGSTVAGEKIRVGEFLEIENNLIKHSKMAISLA